MDFPFVPVNCCFDSVLKQGVEDPVLLHRVWMHTLNFTTLDSKLVRLLNKKCASLLAKFGYKGCFCLPENFPLLAVKSRLTKIS